MAILNNKFFIYSIRAISLAYIVLIVILNLFEFPPIIILFAAYGLYYKRSLYPYNPTFEKVAMVILLGLLVLSMAGITL